MGNKSSSNQPTSSSQVDDNTTRPHKGKLYGLKKRLSIRKKKTETGAVEEVIVASNVSSENAARQSRLSPEAKLKKEDKERRGSVKDNSVNTELWQKILDSSIIGTKLVQKALIFRLSSGAIIVTNPPDFRPSVRQLMNISEGLQNPTAVAKDGLEVLGDVFQYKSGVPGQKIEGVDESGEQVVIVRAGQMYALLGVASWTRRDEVDKLFTELCEYFATQSEF